MSASLRLSGLAVCAFLLVAPPVAAAGDSEGGGAAAESLFQEARKAMDAKRFGDACPKFAASQKLAPAIGTLLNLADCYEKNNQLASAWARFHEAIALAQRLGRSNREQTARERAEKLEPRLIRLAIVTHSSAMEVKLDGNAIDPAVLGTAIPVDAGTHTVQASAKGKKPFSTSIEVSERSRTASVDIPALEDEPKEVVKEERNEKEEPRVTPPPKEEHADGSTQRTIGIVTAGAGVVAVGVGAFFGLKTSSTWNDAKARCTSAAEGLACDAEGVDLGQQARTTGNIATVAFVAGGALLVGGAVLFFTAPSGRKTGRGEAERANGGLVRAFVGPGSIVLRGSF